MAAPATLFRSRFPSPGSTMAFMVLGLSTPHKHHCRHDSLYVVPLTCSTLDRTQMEAVCWTDQNSIINRPQLLETRRIWTHYGLNQTGNSKELTYPHKLDRLHRAVEHFMERVANEKYVVKWRRHGEHLELHDGPPCLSTSTSF